MADNTLQTGSDSIATDDLTTLNGGAITAGTAKAQRVKVGYGDDSIFRDVSTTFPMPAVTPSGYTTGTITAANANITTGTATANSTVQITVPDQHSSWTIQIGGTFSAGTVLYTQASLDGATWFSVNGRRNTDAATNDTTNFVASDFAGGVAPTGSNPSMWRGVCGGIRFFRVTAFSYTAADSVSVQIGTSAGVGATFLNNIPNVQLSDGATATVRATVKAASTAAVAADTSQVVSVHPSSPLPAGTNALGSVTVTSAPTTAVTGTFFQATQPVSMATNTPVIAAGTNQIGTVGSQPSTTGTITSPALALTSFTVLAANTARKTAAFYNDSVNVLYLACAATASTTSYTVQVPAGGYYELPGTNTIYTGIVTGIALTASGNVRVTEMV